MTMIERVAQAMAEKMDGDTWDVKCEDGDGHGYMGKNEYRTMARAAIEAMREPSDAMIRPSNDYTDRLHNKTIWQAMIDAELSKSR